MKDEIEKPEDIAPRVFRFIILVLKMTQTLPKNQINIVLINQIIRCVTSIGANIEEARGAHTKSDFAYGMNIAKKEARETLYWIRLIIAMNPQFSLKLSPFLAENEEIIKMLTAIVKKANPRTF